MCHDDFFGQLRCEKRSSAAAAGGRAIAIPSSTNGRAVRPGGREEGTITRVLCDAAGISD